MKPITVLFFFFITRNSVCSQQASYPFYQLYQLDSIGKAPGISQHFGSLYFDFLQLVEKRLEKADTTTQRLVRNFEKQFAQYYIDACIAYNKKESIALPAWKAYFKDTSLQFYQYYLLGANAHLNGGLAEAIAASYTPAQWKETKKEYVLFNKCLNETYKKVYRETVTNNKRARTLSFLTLGLAKPAGQFYLYKWRKRQMRLTEYLFSSSPKYPLLLKKINRKKDKIDRMVFTQF